MKAKRGSEMLHTVQMTRRQAEMQLCGLECLLRHNPSEGLRAHTRAWADTCEKMAGLEAIQTGPAWQTEIEVPIAGRRPAKPDDGEGPAAA